MSKTVDERVVEMRFDNQQFEKNVATTMSTLDKFKQKLNFRGAGKGIEEIGAAAQKVDMRGLGNGVEEVRMRFSALQVMGVTALANITNSALNAGKRIVSALTIDPVKTGFQEYETQMNAVQTILANTQSKGSTLKDVNAALDELNTYADKTIYNFTEMTRNIGTFTAAGVDLETSVSAIQGIANLAAVSGSTSQQASTAMYQLSQALAAGTVKLMDWNSVVNAGMGGEVFQTALRETSELLGTGAEAAIKAEGSFRESLTKGWLTAEVLTETLKKFTTSGANEYVAEYTGLSTEAVRAALDSAEAQYGEAEAVNYAAKALANKSGKSEEEIKKALQMAKTAEDAATKVKTFTQLWDVMKEAAQSGWAQTWRLIIGDFEEAKNLLTPLADFFTNVIGKMSDARNKLLEGALGMGFGDLAKKFDNLMTPAKKAVETIENVKTTVSDLGDIVDKVIIGKFGNGKERFDKLTEAGENYYRIQNKVNEKLGNSFRYTEEQISAQDKLLGIEKKTAEATSEASEETAKLTDEKKKLIKELASMSEAQLKSKGYTGDQIDAFKQLADTADKLGMPLDEFIDNLDQINGRWLLINSFKNIGQGLVTTIKSIGAAWRDIFPAMQSEQLFNIIAGFHKFTTYLKVNEETADKLRRTFKGVFAALDIALTVIGGPLKIVFKALTQFLKSLDLGILDVTANIGDTIVKFRDWIDSVLDFSGLFEKIVPYLTKFSDKIKGIFKSIKDTAVFDKLIKSLNTLVGLFKKLTKLDIGSIEFKDIVGQIRKVISSIPDEMAEIGRNIIKGLQNGIGDEASVVFAKIREVGTKIIETIKAILGIHSPSTVMYEIGTNIVEGLVNGISAGLQFLVNGIAYVGNKIVEIFNGLDFSGVGNSLEGFFGKLKELLSGFDWKKLLAIIPIGVTLMIVKRIYDFTKVLADGINSINGLIDGLADIEASFSKVLKSYATNIKADALKKIATAIAILVGSVIALTFIEPAKLYNAVIVIGILSGILVGLAFAMDKMSGASAKIDKGGIKLGGLKTSLIAMAASLLLLAATVKILGNMDPDQAKQGFIGLAGLVLALAGVFAAYGLLVKGKAAQNMDKAGTMLLKMSVSLFILVKVAKMLSGVTWPELGKAAAFVSGFAVFVGALVFVTKFAGRNISKVGSMLLKISIAIGLMVGVCKLVNTLSPEEMEKGAVFASGFLAFVGLLVLLTKIGPKDQIAKIGGLLLSISMSMMIMIGVCKLAAKLSPEEIKAGVTFMAGFLVFVGLLVMITTIGGDKQIAKVAATLIAMSIAVGILAGVAVLLSMLDPEALKNGVLAVSMLGLVMAAMIWATKDSSKCVGNIIALSIAVAVMAGAIAALSFVDPERLSGAVLAMTIVMGMFALIMKMTENMPKVTLTLLAMGVAIGILGGVLYLLGSLPAESTIGAATALSIAMLAFAGAMRIISGMEAPSGKALLAIGVMALVVGALGGVLYLLRDLDPAQGVATVGVISAFLAVLLIAVLAMQAIQDPSIKGLAALAIVTLVVIALAGVLYLLRDVDPEQAMGIVKAISVFLFAMEGVCIVAAAVGALAEFAIPGLIILVGFIGALGLVVIGLADLAMDVIAGMPKLGSDLSAFMTNVQPFIDGIQNIPDDISDKIGKLCGAILKLTGTEILDAIASFFSGGSSLADLGAELKTFGEGMGAFSASIGNIDAAVASMSKIKDVQTAVEDVDLSALSSLSEKLESYSIKASALNIVAIGMSISAATQLMHLINSLLSVDPSGIGKFNILPLGQAMQIYSVSVSGINQAAISASINSASRLRDFINSLTSLDASGIGGFQSAINQLGTISITKVVEAFKGGTSQLYKAGADLLNSAVKGMESVRGTVIKTVNDLVEAIRKAFESRKSSFEATGKTLVSYLNAGLNSNKSTLVKTTQAIATSSAMGIRQKWNDFYDSGKFLAEGFASGISVNDFKAKAAAAAMAQAALDAAKEVLRENSPSKETAEIGNYFGMGFVNSIGDYADRAYKVGSEMADSARTGLSDAISRIQNILNSDMDTQPTIRPVLDLSNVESGVNRIGGMFGNESIGLKTNINSISSAVSQRRQNGVNQDVVSAINKLRKDFSELNRPSYSINGITYDDGSNVASAIQTLVRAAKIERRV